MANFELPASFQGQINAYKQQLIDAAQDGTLDPVEARRLANQERGLAWLAGYDGEKIGAAQAEALAQAAGDVFARIGAAAGGDPKRRAQLLAAFSSALRKQASLGEVIGADGEKLSPLQAMIQGLDAVQSMKGADFKAAHDYDFRGTRKGAERARNLFSKIGGSNWFTSHLTRRVAELEARGIAVSFYADGERAPHARPDQAWIKLPFSRGRDHKSGSVKKAWRSARNQLERTLDRTEDKSAKRLLDGLPRSPMRDLLKDNLRIWDKGEAPSEAQLAAGMSGPDRSAELTSLLNLATARGLDLSGIADAPTVELAILGLDQLVETGVWPGWDDLLKAAQELLGIAGFIPLFGEIADVANLVINLVTGNYFDAVCDAISLIPGAGSVVGQGAKKLKKTLDWALDAARRGDRHAMKVLDELQPAAERLYDWAREHGKEFVDATMKKLRAYGDELDEWVEWAGGPKNAVASAERFIYSGLDELMNLAAEGSGRQLRREVKQTIAGTPEGALQMHRKGDLMTVNFGDPRGKHSRYAGKSMDELEDIARDRNSDFGRAIRNRDAKFGGQLSKEALEDYDGLVARTLREGTQKNADGKSFIVLELEDPIGVSVMTGQPTNLVRLDFSPPVEGQINGAHLIPWQ